MQKRSGFSVVELLIVLTLAGIFAVVSIMVGKNVLQRANATAAINSFVADVSLIKQLASKENRYYAIGFMSTGASAGKAYQIQRQTTIGDLANWTVISTKTPIEGKEFFDSSMITGSWKGFAVSPLGMVYNLPIGAGAVPTTQSFPFRLAGTSTPSGDYPVRIMIYSNGGVKIVKQ